MVISSDDIRAEFGNIRDQSKNEKVFMAYHKRIRDALIEGKNVIAEATNITYKSRKITMDIVKRFDCHKKALIVTKLIEECVESDKGRPKDIGEKVIMKQVKKFQIPFYEEGFDEIDEYRK